MNLNDASYCACANILCAQYGCIRQQPAQTYPSPNYALLYSQLHTQRGCICPPGANKECENQYCPRKPLPVSAHIEVKK